MVRSRTILKGLVGFYAAVVSLAAVWAWYVGLSLLNDPREHLLPDALLMALSWPTSLTLYGVASLLTSPLAPLAWLTACGALQAGLLCWWSAIRCR